MHGAAVEGFAEDDDRHIRQQRLEARAPILDMPARHGQKQTHPVTLSVTRSATSGPRAAPSPIR